jgi:hypothetical protein
MTLAALLNRPCTIIRRVFEGDLDDYGNEIPTEITVAAVCELQQRQRSEDTDRGEVSATSWLLVLPAGTEIGSGDSIVIDGEVYELDGDPWEARNPRTRQPSHIEATVVRTAGAGQDGAS